MNSQTALPPFPEGWFFICYAHELTPGKLFTKTFMGQEIVAFRDAQGKAAVLDAICPHLGAHMGKGGCVKEGTVECPFHKFRFDESGACSHVPGADPPKRARVKSWPVQETHGLIMAYHDVQGQQPTWWLPDIDTEGWSKLAHHHYYIKGHPQETTENSVDSAHLVTIHGYDQVTTLKKPVVEGAHMTAAFQMTRGSRGVLKALGLGVEVTFDVHVWGLGWSMVDITAPKVGLRVRLWTLSTPSDGEHIDLHIAVRVKHLENPGKLVPGLDRIPKDWLRAFVLQMSKLAYKHDIEQDFFIWENKQYQPRPQLARNDGPVTMYRRYCRQFYPQLRDESSAEAAQ